MSLNVPNAQLDSFVLMGLYQINALQVSGAKVEAPLQHQSHPQILELNAQQENTVSKEPQNQFCAQKVNLEKTQELVMKLIVHPALLDRTVFQEKPLHMLAQQATIVQSELKNHMHVLKELITTKNQEKVSMIAKSVLLDTCAKPKVSHISPIILVSLATFVLKELLGI